MVDIELLLAVFCAYVKSLWRMSQFKQGTAPTPRSHVAAKLAHQSRPSGCKENA
jgi:hypothetical protein